MMDKILMLRYDMGDYVPMAFQQWIEFGFDENDDTTFFYCPEEHNHWLAYPDQASFMCIDNIAVEPFFVIMFPALDLSGIENVDFAWECLADAGYENAIEEILDKYQEEKQKRLSYSIEYEEDTYGWESVITEGYYFIRTKGLQ